MDKPSDPGVVPPKAFAEERPEPPLNGRHYLDTTFPDISPQELLQIAAPLAANGATAHDAVSKAYELFTEAHFFCRNLSQWNEKVRRHHSPDLIFQIVDQSQRNKKGQPLRRPLLVAFFDSRGLGKDATNASKRFNAWLEYLVRFDDFKATIPWSPAKMDVDTNLHQMLGENGWIDWFYEGGTGHLKLPPKTEPSTLTTIKAVEGEHPTRRYWNTTDVWWPKANDELLDRYKSRYLNEMRDAFLSEHSAREALKSFGDWLDLEGLMKREANLEKPKRQRSGDGRLVSPKDKGAGRGAGGEFGKKKKT